MKNSLATRYQNISIFTALFCMGYVASLFLTYSFIVMPGLAGLDDRTFVAAFQGLETRFQNASDFPGYIPFGYGNIPALIAFPGALIFSLLAGFLHLKTTHFKWILLAIVLFLAGMVSTVLYNLPANFEIFAAGDSSQINVSEVRRNFNEKVWLYSNHFRAMTTTCATFCLSWTLYVKIKSRASESLNKM